MKKQIIIVAALFVLLIVAYVGYSNKHAIKMMLTGSTQPTASTSTNTFPTPSATSGLPEATPATTKGIINTMNDPKKGSYLASSTGLTLYTYDKDTKNAPSVCSGGCAKAWPAYETKTVPSSLPTGVTTTKNPDGAFQYAYKGMNLYYYANDEKPGDATGDGVGGIWHIVQP